MKRFDRIPFLLCGIALLLAAFPVFAQEKETFTIDRKPLEDFVATVRQKIEKKETNFDAPFEVEFESALTDDGKFDAKKSKFTRTEGDAQMVELAKTAIQALGDSGFFYNLKSSIEIEKNFSFSLKQDDDSFSSVLKWELATKEKAEMRATSLRTMLNMFLALDKNAVKKLGDNTRTILNNLTVNNKKKNAIMIFSMPKADFHEMILRLIMNPEEKNKNVQS